MLSWLSFVLLLILSILILIIITYYHWISNYPKFCELTGPNKYIGISYHQTCINNIRFKLYYPSSKYLVEVNKSETPKYFKDGKKAAKGLQHLIGHTIKIPLFLINSVSLLKYKKYKTPCYINAPIFIPPNSSNKNNNIYPLILLSHGLGGNWDVYTQICCNLASFGLIIAAIEHSDGSASHCKTASGYDLYYVSQHIINKNGIYSKPKFSEWNRKHTIEFRGQQTDKRVQNMCDVYQYLCNYKSISNDIKLQKLIVPYINFNYIFIAGHSFGGITAVMTTKILLNKTKICGCIVFEPWFEPKSNNDLSEKWDVPYLVIIGDRWTKIKRLWDSMIIVFKSNMNKNDIYFEHFKGYSHIDFCDGVLMGPQFILRKLNACCKSLDIQQSQDLYCKRCVQFIANLSPKWKSMINENDYKKYYQITENEYKVISRISETEYDKIF
eukprot:60332_1